MRLATLDALLQEEPEERVPGAMGLRTQDSADMAEDPQRAGPGASCRSSSDKVSGHLVGSGHCPRRPAPVAGCPS